MITNVTIWYLEINDPAALKPKRVELPGVRIERSEVPCPEFSRFLYQAAGGDLYWTERLPWDWHKWFDYLNRDEFETWVLWVSGTPAGYVELEKHKDNSVKIVYFGLLPVFIGRGLGGHLLTFAIERGFAMGADRVWVHTCSLDTPAALPNYRARGMTIYRERTFQRDLQIPAPGPWPDANRPGFCPTRQ